MPPDPEPQSGPVGSLPPRIVVVGASMGGLAALSTFVSRLPADFPVPLLVVLHTGSYPSILPELLSARGPSLAVAMDEALLVRRGLEMQMQRLRELAEHQPPVAVI